MTEYVQLSSGLVISEASFAEMKNIRPELREIASTLDGRDITRGFVDPMMIQLPQDSILNERLGGDYTGYSEILRDDQVAATFHQRRLAVVSRDWDVQPGGKKRADKKAADFLREVLDHIRFDAVTDKMLFGVFYGHAVAECLWARDGAHVTLDQVRVRDRRRFGFDGRGLLRLKTMANPDGEELPERKFWSFQTGADHDDDPYGLGLAHWLYWPVFFKRNGIKFWLIFLEKFGQPTGKGKYPQNATPAERQRLLAALRAIHTDAGIIIPEGMEIELIEAARSGTVDYATLCDRMDRGVAKIVLGQVASTEGTPGKLGNEELQQDVRLDLVKADADLVCNSFTRQVGRWLTEWNFPGAAVPKVWRDVEDPEDLGQVAEREKKIYDMGFRPTLRHIQDTYGGEWTEAQREPEPDQPPPDADPDNTGTEFAENDPAADITDQQIEQLAAQADPVIENWIEQIREQVDLAENLEDLRDRLLDLYPEMDATQFAEVMGDALSAAHMAGRYDILMGV